MSIKLYIIVLFSCFTLGHVVCQEINYYQHIQPIIQNHCVQCHSANGAAPMPFTNYNEVTAYARMIEFVTESGYMPPWHAEKGGLQMSNVNLLTEAEIKEISQWVNAGAPEDISAENHSGLTFEHLQDYDMEISMSDSFEQYGIYYDQFQVFVVPFDAGPERQIEAIEFIPGDRSIVRSCHISITQDPTILVKDEWDPRYGYYSFAGLDFTPEYSHWFSWTTGDKVTRFGSDEKLFLPGKGFMLLHIFYGPTGSPKRDLSKIRLKFSEKHGDIVSSYPLLNPYNLTMENFNLPVDQKTIHHASVKIPFDLTLFSVLPQSNLITESWEIFAKIPGKKLPIKILQIDEWDFKWKTKYILEEPLALPEGTEIHGIAKYNNTMDNLQLPDDRLFEIAWGSKMIEELFLVHLDLGLNDDNDKRNPFLQPGPINITSDKLEVVISNAENETLACELYSWEGEKIIQFDDPTFLSGQKPFDIDVTDLTKGLYYIQLSNRKHRVLSRRIFVLWNRGMM